MANRLQNGQEINSANTQKTETCLLTNIYSEAIMREIEVLLAFINGRHKLNNIRYVSGTVVIAGRERKLQDLPQMVKKGKRKERTKYKL